LRPKNCVLDLGCGTGLTPQKLGLPENWQIIGMDVNEDSLQTARKSFPSRAFVRGNAESLPFADESFWRVVSNLAVPYMDVPVALAEMYRVLQPGCEIVISTHSAAFTFSELEHDFHSTAAILYRFYVLLNGVYFHLTGRLLRFSTTRIESFQTRRAMRRALEKQGFSEVRFRFDGRRYMVEAKKNLSLANQPFG
jgi:ubiquinone/menaquinone biosynthesis C-methylase UbiE